MALFAREADRMQRDGLDQWQPGIYPLTEHIEADIRSGYGWGGCQQRRRPGLSEYRRHSRPVLRCGQSDVEDSARGKEGTWVMHRLIVAEEARGMGLARKLIEFAATQSPNGHLRADTDPKTRPCGHCLSGSDSVTLDC